MDHLNHELKLEAYPLFCFSLMNNKMNWRGEIEISKTSQKIEVAKEI
jgi:hypothetical protein